MEDFKINYKIIDPTISPNSGFNPIERTFINIRGALWGIHPKEYLFDIQVGDFIYSVERELISEVQRSLEKVLNQLLGFKKTLDLSSDDAADECISPLSKKEKYCFFTLENHLLVIDIPSWNFVFTPTSDEVKVYPRLYRGLPPPGTYLPLLPPWNIAEGQPTNQPPILCSKKQIAAEFYQLYLHMVQDAKKMYPVQFNDKEWMEEPYQKWLEQMGAYKKVISKL
jgi:hypothetical protein